VVPKLVLVVVFNDGADSMVGFGGRVNRWMGLWWVTMMGLGEVVFSGELFGGLISGFRWVLVMVGFDVIWPLGWVCGESRWVYGGLFFGFVTDSDAYMVLVVVVVLVFFFFWWWIQWACVGFVFLGFWW